MINDSNGEHCWGNWAWEDCSSFKRNSSDFSNRGCMSVSRNCFAALSKPHSCVPAIPGELERLDILQKDGSVPDNMYNPDCGFEVG